MVLNNEKCKVMNIGKANNGWGFTIENEASQRILLNKTTSERDLGIEISNDLKTHKLQSIFFKQGFKYPIEHVHV